MKYTVIKKEKIVPIWINESDIETDFKTVKKAG